MKRPAVFFDRDNTLIASDGYLGDPAKVTLVDGAAAAVAAVRGMGFATVVFSNQSGVARGLFDEDAVHAVNARLDSLLLRDHSEALIDRHDFCPYHPEAVLPEYRRDSDLRKPRPGMILAAAKAMDLDLGRSWVIGDTPRDIAAGAAAGCRTILLRDPKLAPSPDADEQRDISPDFTVSSLAEAIAAIRHATVRTGPSRTAQGDGEIGAALGLRVEHLLEQVVQELRHTRQQSQADFSVTRLLGGIVQVLALACLFFAYLNRGDASALQSLLLLALTLEAMTIALLLMGYR